MITLQEFTPADFSRLIAWVSNEDMLIQFAGPIFQYPLTEKQLCHYLSDPQRRAFKVLSGLCTVGHAEIMLSEDGITKLCRILVGNAEDRGKGLGEQIVRALVQRCWKKYNAREIELNVYDWNKGAIRCYEKVGFVERQRHTVACTTGSETRVLINMVLRR